jgi:hypothetical protein
VFATKIASCNMEFLIMSLQSVLVDKRLVTSWIRAWKTLGGSDFQPANAQVCSTIVVLLVFQSAEYPSTSWENCIAFGGSLDSSVGPGAGLDSGIP